MTREEFISFIKAMFPDNIKREITEAKLRDVSEKIANLCYDSQDIASSAAGTIQTPITPESTAPIVTNGYWAVTIPGTYTNFGNVNLPANNFGFIFKNGNSYSIQSIEMPMQDLTPLENEIESKLSNKSDRVMPVNSSIGLYDRPDLEDKSYIVDKNNNIVDVLLSEKDRKSLLPKGTEVDYFDRPDLEEIILVDKNNNYTPKKEDNHKSISKLEIPLWKTPILPSFNMPSSGDDTILGNYNTLISEYDKFLAVNNPNLDSPYVKKTKYSESQVGNYDLFSWSFTPSNPKMKMLITSGTHANEKMYIWGVHQFIKELINNWQSSSFLEFLRFNVAIDVVPCVNPYSLSNSLRKRGFRTTPETEPISFTWTKSQGIVTITFSESDFPSDDYLSASNYFTAVPKSSLENKASLGIRDSSDIESLPLGAYKILEVVNARTVKIQTNSIELSTSGTGKFQVWVDPNRNYDIQGSNTWHSQVGNNVTQDGDNGVAVGYYDNKGTRPYSLRTSRALMSLVDSSNYDYVIDCHAPAGDCYISYDTINSYVPNLGKILEESGAFVSTTKTIHNTTSSPAGYFSIWSERNKGITGHLIEWGSGLTNATSLDVTNAVRWLGIVLKDTIEQKINNK